MILLDDFVEIPGALTNDRLQIGDDEKNLLYVAITRAKKNLVVSQNIYNLLVSNGEFFERVDILNDKDDEMHQKGNEDARSLSCIVCHQNIVPYQNRSFSVYQSRVNVGPYRRGTGMLCSVCCMQNIQNIPIWMNNHEQERTLAIPDLYRSSLRFICGPNARKDIKRAKDIFIEDSSNDPVWWEAQIL